MHFETKVAVVVRDDLAIWQRLNVTAFLASGVAAAHPDCIGEPYEDADGAGYHALLGEPVVVLCGDGAAVRRGFDRARRRELPLAIYTAGMFETGHDQANRAVVRAVPTAELDLVGFALRADRKQADKALHGLRLHP